MKTSKKISKKKFKTAKQRRKDRITTGILVFIFLLGVGIMAYPTFSDWWNTFHQSRAITSYVNMVENISEEESTRMLEAAEAYNRSLLGKSRRYELTDEERAEYEKLLNLAGTGVIGYININTIGINLPVYHGTDESVLQTAIGHLEWTSLPVGGESTHAALSGHRGLPSARLFTDLDKLKEGDIFTVTVLTRMVTYCVDQIRIVEPTDISDLNIQMGQDYCTLVTCTPYGINTHRMLVRGHRIENVAGEVAVTAGAIKIPNYIAIPAVGIPMLFAFLIVLLVIEAVKPKQPSDEDLEKLYEASKRYDDGDE